MTVLGAERFPEGDVTAKGFRAWDQVVGAIVFEVSRN